MANNTINPQGRFVITKIVNDNNEAIVLANVYAPNEDNPSFSLIYLSIFKIMNVNCV